MENTNSRAHWRDWLGLNASTLALLGAILLVTAATELWSPLIPHYLKQLQQQALGGEVGLLLLIGAYGFYRDALEGINYYAGGTIAARINTRRAMLLFNVIPLVGLAMIAFWTSRAAVFLAIPFVMVWDSISGPAVITVVGDSLPPDRRTMAFSLQAIMRRVSRMLAYSISALLIGMLGDMRGIHADAIVAAGLVGIAFLVQYRFMRTASKDVAPKVGNVRAMVREYPTNLKRLLAADIFARWAEGLAGPLIILYCVPILSANMAHGAAKYQSVLLNIQAVVNIALYIIVGPMASRAGLAKKPFIGLTFFFFALFPISLVVFGELWGALGLMLAFVIGGMRELGEPARKAMIADLVPRDSRTQAIGVYWSVRSFAVMLASPVGALLWIAGEKWKAGTGPMLTFGAAGLVGMIGAFLFYMQFGQGEPHKARSD